MHARTHALAFSQLSIGEWDDKNRAQVQGPRGIAKACGWTGAYLLKGSSKSFPQDKHESSEVVSFTDHATHKK